MNYYDRITMFKNMNEREKINSIHELFLEINKNCCENYNPFDEYIQKLKEADDIFVKNNYFYS